jgi:hypothetical protein
MIAEELAHGYVVDVVGGNSMLEAGQSGSHARDNVRHLLLLGVFVQRFGITVELPCALFLFLGSDKAVVLFGRVLVL